MNFKNLKASREVVTRDLSQLEEKTNNIYKTINILAKRANQINSKLKLELTQKFEEFSTAHVDNLEEVTENNEQVEISKHYEKLPKPTILAIEEYSTNQLHVVDKSGSRVEDEA